MKCFVIMPFSFDNSDSIYENWIKATVEEMEFKNERISCHRADKSSRPGEVIAHLMENLISSEIVIADLTGKNPNVFYELGVRHALATNTILISQDLQDIPFDLRGQRIIIYKFTPDGMLKLKKEIKEYVTSIVEQPESIDNPVRQYIYNEEIRKFFDNKTLANINLVETLISEISLLKKSFSEQLVQVAKVVEALAVDKIDVSNNSPSIPDLSELKFYEGAWLSTDSDSYLYAKIHDDRLLIPYCYGGNEKLTSHYFDLMQRGNYLVGRFKWFNGRHYGFMYMEKIDSNNLRGGWLSTADMSFIDQNNYFELSEFRDGMYHMWWKRIEGVSFQEYPNWAKQYFNEKKYVYV